MGDPWSKDSTLSTRAFDNSRDVEAAAIAILVDVRLGAFVSADTMGRIDRALEYLTEARAVTIARWVEHLDAQHEVRAA
jgi:hypothetical protein